MSQHRSEQSRDPKTKAPEQDLPGEEVLSDVDLFLEGLQFVLSDCLCEGLSWLGKVPAKHIRERHKKHHFSLAVPIQHQRLQLRLLCCGFRNTYVLP